jgi:hypothetical protein
MKNRAFIVLFALAAASCTTKNENSALVISKVIPAKATADSTTNTVSCAFDSSLQEFTPYLPFNVTENAGVVGATVDNNLVGTTNSVLQTDSHAFLPHQAVITYEYLGSTVSAPGQNIVPTTGIEIPSGQSGTVGVDMFRGVTTLASLAAGTIVRTTFHIEGKLLDGSTVHTAEREYLFQICTRAGCGLASPWAALAGTAPSNGAPVPSCAQSQNVPPCIASCF